MKLNPEIFREYDVRGRVDQDLDEAVVYQMGRALEPMPFSKALKTMAVGRDCRLSSEGYAQAIQRGLLIQVWIR
jgi:phosphomannomutase/phosphoglucomutase